MRVLFFGMEGAFSSAPLRALLSEFEVCGVVVPRPEIMSRSDAAVRVIEPPARRGSVLPVMQPALEPTVVGLAWRRDIPVLEVGRLSQPATIAALRDLRPDVIVVACFLRLLPRVILDLPRHVALNVHPSMLPEYRGPSPLFWIFHDGLERAGVSVHIMEGRADSGAVVGQSRIDLPDGISYDEAERVSAEVGGRLLVESLRAQRSGSLRTMPQPTTGVSYARRPEAADFVMTPSWAARRAFNFARGMSSWSHTIEVAVGDERFAVSDALAFGEVDTMPAPLEVSGGVLRLRCSPGVVTLRLREEIG